MELIRRRTDYALRCLADLAEAGSERPISVHTLAKTEQIPEDLLHKIMQRLTARKIVKARRGRSGGFRLAKLPQDITILEVIEVMQGPLALNRCFMGDNRCRRQEVCWLRSKLSSVQEEMCGFFRCITITDLLHGHSLVAGTTSVGTTSGSPQ